jgi:hypothetical protein
MHRALRMMSRDPESDARVARHDVVARANRRVKFVRGLAIVRTARGAPGQRDYLLRIEFFI